jgi:hypothetical protein
MDDAVILQEAHTKYRAAGFSTIPVARSGGIAKRPLVAWTEYQDRQPRDGEIRLWATKWPTSNIGLIMANSRHLAIDVDGDLGLAYQALLKLGVSFSANAPVQRTGKGHHILMSTTEPVGDAVAWLKGDGWQIDVRGIGYIIVEPSIHQNGMPYQWIRPFCAPAPPASARLLELLLKREEREESEGLYAPPAKEGWIADMILHGSPEGQRNHDGARLAGYVFRSEPPDIARAIVYCFAEHCSPPMSRYEADLICDSIGRRAAMQRGNR